MKKIIGMGAIGLVGAMAAAAPASAAGETGKITSVVRSGCTITITAHVNQAGSYGVEVWDDRVQTGAYTKATTAPGNFTVTHVFDRNVGTAATGIDINLRTSASSRSLDLKKNWDFPGSSHVLDSCKTSDGKDSGETKAPAPMPTKKPAPTKTGTGPRVDTDRVASSSTNSMAGLEAAGALAAMAGGGVLLRRRMNKSN